jgi:hypothetical protein
MLLCIILIANFHLGDYGILSILKPYRDIHFLY